MKSYCRIRGYRWSLTCILNRFVPAIQNFSALVLIGDLMLSKRDEWREECEGKSRRNLIRLSRAWVITTEVKGLPLTSITLSAHLSQLLRSLPKSLIGLYSLSPSNASMINMSQLPTLLRLVSYRSSRYFWSARSDTGVCRKSQGLRRPRSLVAVGHCLIGMANPSRRLWTETRVQLRRRYQLFSRSTGPTWALEGYISIKTPKKNGLGMLNVWRPS